MHFDHWYLLRHRWHRALGSCHTLALFGLLLLMGATPTTAQASDADCYNFFRKQKFAEASACFEKEAKAIGANPTGPNKLKKGRMLRNAALSLDRAAKRSGAAKAAGYRIKAISILNNYLSEKLYPDSAMKSATEKLRSTFRSQIGYANLRLVTSQANAEACITAPGYRKCNTGAFWSLKLLPRTYEITVTYPLTPPVTKTQTWKAVSRTQKTLVFTPPVKKIALISVVTGDTRATIVLKGKSLKAPLTHTGASWTKQLPPGDYELMVVYPDQAPLKREVKLVMGQPEVQIFNRPGPPVLIINTTPINAQVFIDGQYSGNTGLRLKLKPGKVKVEIKRGCYTIVTKELDIKANQEYPISVILQRDPAYLNWSGAKKGGAGTALGWTALLAGVAIAGVGGAMYGVASGKSSDALERRPYDFPGYQQLAGENNTFVTIGHVGIGVGVVGIGIGIAALLVSRPKSKFDIPCKVPLKADD